MKFGTLLVVIFFAFPAFAAEDAQSVLADYRAFSKMSNRVLHEEPTLVQNSNFDQKLTLKYQRYANSQEAIPFKMIFSIAPEAVKLEQLSKAYLKYGREATGLSDELPLFVRGHVSMITEAAYAAKYRRRYGEVVKTIFTAGDGSLNEFKVFDCDYTTQPTDAFWYVVHARELLDRYGTALFGAEWEAKREELRKKFMIRSADEVRAAFETSLNAEEEKSTEPTESTSAD